MRTIRVFALGAGWLLLLSGSATCVSAVVLAVAVGAGTLGGSVLTSVLLLACGIALMVSAMPLMFVGVTEFDHNGHSTPPRHLNHRPRLVSSALQPAH